MISVIRMLGCLYLKAEALHSPVFLSTNFFRKLPTILIIQCADRIAMAREKQMTFFMEKSKIFIIGSGKFEKGNLREFENLWL